MLKKVFLPLAIACVAALSTTERVDAQIMQLPGTGCPNAPFTQAPLGAPTVGRVFVACGADTSCQNSLLIIGTRRSVPLSLTPPITCEAGPCLVVCESFVVLTSRCLTTVVPNNNDLVGRCLCIQGVCFDSGRTCITVDGAIRACILPAP